MKPYTLFDVQYLDLIENCLVQPLEKDLRTKEKCRSMGSTNLSFHGLPILTLRDIDIKKSINEALLYMYDSNHILLSISHELESYPTSKNCIFRIVFGHIKKYNSSVVVYVHFSIVNEVLDMSVFQTSTDIYHKLPHNITGFCIMWYLFSSHLTVEPGVCNWTIGNVYLLDDDDNHNIDKMLDEGSYRVGEIPNFDLIVDGSYFNNALKGKETLIHDIYQKLQPAYDKLKGPKL